MRRMINSTFMTLDGVVEDPHLWPSPGDSEGQADAINMELLESCDAVLMGRRTYEIFASAWPARAGDPFADRLNAMQKYVVSTTLREPAWHNTVVIRDDVAAELARLKERPGRAILQYGIGAVTYTLLEHGLVDEFRLWMYPLIRGRAGESTPHFLSCPETSMRFVDTTTLPNGVAILRYEVRSA